MGMIRCPQCFVLSEARKPHPLTEHYTCPYCGKVFSKEDTIEFQAPHSPDDPGKHK